MIFNENALTTVQHENDIASISKRAFPACPNHFFNLKPKALFVILATVRIMLMLMEEPCQLYLAC